MMKALSFHHLALANATSKYLCYIQYRSGQNRELKSLFPFESFYVDQNY